MLVLMVAVVLKKEIKAAFGLEGLTPEKLGGMCVANGRN